jgi:hypothetical protein
MGIRKWHFGKLIILWCWCGVPAALFITDFQLGRADASVGRHLFDLAGALSLLLFLSAVTWHWLGDRAEDKS